MRRTVVAVSYNTPSTMATSSIPFKSFSLANQLSELSPEDEIFAFDADAHKQILRQAPWDKE